MIKFVKDVEISQYPKDVWGEIDWSNPEHVVAPSFRSPNPKTARRCDAQEESYDFFSETTPFRGRRPPGR